MSHRTLKRVSLDFDWPIDRVWKGYINPHSPVDCHACKRSGMSPDGKFLSESWYRHGASDGMFGNWYGSNVIAVPGAERLKQMGWSKEVIDNIERARKFGFKILAHWADKLEAEDIQALMEAERLKDFTHTWNGKDGWIPKVPFVIPTPDQVNAAYGSGLGHDSLNQWACIKARCKPSGVEYECSRCLGAAVEWPDPVIKKRHDAWKEEEPPKGPGWQLWETVSEGSPMSPVFETADELAEWCVTYKGMGPGSNLSKEQCLRLMHNVEDLENGSTMIISSDGIKLLAERELGEPTTKDWSPSPK